MPARLKLYIGVAGSSEEPGRKLAEIADAFLEKLDIRNFKVAFILGGYWGFMKYFADRALEKNYEVVFILPENPPAMPPNRENAVIVQTELGFRTRSAVLCSMADFLIVFGGGIGSMIEALLAYDFGKPVVIVKTGYDTDKLCTFGEYFDKRMRARVYCVESVDELLKVVNEIVSQISKPPPAII